MVSSGNRRAPLSKHAAERPVRAPGHPQMGPAAPCPGSGRSLFTLAPVAFDDFGGIAFGDDTRARLVRLVIVGHQGAAPAVEKILNEVTKQLLEVK